jgi:uncharacterized membrane protein SpoIIM required for sporulation
VDWPTAEHLFYIPAILLVGIAFGFRLGAKAARAELEKRRRERME